MKQQGFVAHQELSNVQKQHQVFSSNTYNIISLFLRLSTVEQ